MDTKLYIDVKFYPAPPQPFSDLEVKVTDLQTSWFNPCLAEPG